MEKRVLIASILSAAVLGAYVHFFAPKPQPTTSAVQTTSISSQQGQQIVPKLTDVAPEERSNSVLFVPDEALITLESENFLIEVGESSAAVHSVTTKKFKDIQHGHTLKFGGDHLVGRLDMPHHEHKWTVSQKQATSVVWSCHSGDVPPHELTLRLDEATPTFSYKLSFVEAPVSAQVRVLLGWKRTDTHIAPKYNLLEVILKAEKRLPWQRTHIKYQAGVGRVVPRRTYIATVCERFFCESVKLDNRYWSAEVLQTPRDVIAASLSASLEGQEDIELPFYVGPRDFFSMRDAGFEDAFPRGFLSKIGLLLMVILKFLASVTKNYGAALILLAAGITTVFSPFSIAGFRSMKRMQELQPKVDQIKKKYEKDPTRMNKEIFALFKENKVSPIGGCLPMLLQLPIFFALWSAISQVIELRGASFLWIKDLTLPDHLVTLPLGIPLNILPILMACAMFVQSKLTAPKKPIEGQPNFMTGPMMSILFGVMFYQVPSALVLYWLTNSLVSITWYRTAKL